MKPSNTLPLIAAVFVAICAVFFLFSGNNTPSTFKSVQQIKQGKLLIKGERLLKLCPQPSQLHYSHLKWTAPGGWHSIDKPLTNQVGSFAKAQWQGVNLGEVICQYKSAGNTSFPIELHRMIGKVVYEPIDMVWKKTHAGTKTCFSNRVSNCPFYQRKAEKQKPLGVIYKEIFQLDS